jgi:hypothetical protein
MPAYQEHHVAKVIFVELVTQMHLLMPINPGRLSTLLHQFRGGSRRGRARSR